MNCIHTHIHSYTAEIQSGSVHNDCRLWKCTRHGFNDVSVWSKVSALSLLEESKSVLCLKASGRLLKKKKKKMTRVYELFLPPQSPLLKLILSILGCDFCSPTTVSVPVTELCKETSFWIVVLKKKKGTTCWRSTAGTEGSCHTLSVSPVPLAFRSSSIRRGYMQGKRSWGHMTGHAASQRPPS